MSSLGAQRIAKLSCHVPPSGGWLANVTLETGAMPSAGPATLTIGDLSLVGQVLPGRGGEDAPDQPRVVVAGGAGWRLPLTRGSYQSPGGVRLSTVLRDLATQARETFAAPAESFLGLAYGWPASTPAAPVYGRTVLADLVRLGVLPTWRVGTDGATRFDRWPPLPAADKLGRVTARRLGEGARCLGLDNVAAAFLPGATVEGVTIARVMFSETAGQLTVEVWES